MSAQFPTFLPPYQAMTSYVARARPRAELWRTLLGLILWAFFAMSLFVVCVVPVVMMIGSADLRADMAWLMDGDTPRGVLGLLYSFLPQMLALMLAVFLLMRRGPLSLTGPIGPALRNFARVAVPLMVLWLVMMPLSVQGGNVRQNLTLAELLPWLPAALLGLLIQTATEELIFRGYLQQQLAARYAARWVWLGVPALLFGLAHYAPGNSPVVTGLTMLWATCFGLVAADLTARTGNLGAALALHFTNNVSAILLVGVAGNLGGLTLYQVTVDPDQTMTMVLYLSVDGVALLAGWLTARVVLRR
ncbi:MAG: CPBP family intramembrane metalloprotease [Candidatus Saccharibacteria bacterium]|nr:CPBP family intramembrane metalloprotease [Pseudorhodobacter sp.]